MDVVYSLTSNIAPAWTPPALTRFTTPATPETPSTRSPAIRKPSWQAKTQTRGNRRL